MPEAVAAPSTVDRTKLLPRSGIGVEAPSDVNILREEIVTQITTENQRAYATAEVRDLLGVGSATGGSGTEGK